MEKKFPNKDQPLIIGCSNGTTYSIDALELLDEAGYTCLVGLKGCASQPARGGAPQDGGSGHAGPRAGLAACRPTPASSLPRSHPTPSPLFLPPSPPSRSGFYAWFRVFDNKGGRRRSGEYAETVSRAAGRALAPCVLLLPLRLPPAGCCRAGGWPASCSPPSHTLTPPNAPSPPPPHRKQYTHDGDTCGIHASGAGFARVDAIEHWVPPTF